MKTMWQRVALVVLVCGVVHGATYTQHITGLTSTLVIPASAWSPGTNDIGVAALDGLTNRLSLSVYSWSVDASTYDVTVHFNPAVRTGSVSLITYTALTTASTDWQVTQSGWTLTVCSACASGPAAVRANGGSTVYALPRSYVLTISSIGGGGSDVRAYIASNGFVTFGFSGTYLASCVPASMCNVQGSVSSYPGGSVSLGKASYTSSGYVGGSLTDDRPATFQ